MRVLFVTHCFGDEINGPVIYARLLWERFSSDPDIDFHMLTLEAPSEIRHPNLHVVPKEQQSNIGHRNLKLLAKDAQRLARSLGSKTLVHLNAAHIPYQGDWKEVVCNVNDTVVAAGGLWPLIKQYGFKRGLSFYYRKSAERYAVTNAQRVIVNSEYTAEVVRRAYGDPGNIEVIYKAVDCSAFVAVKEARKTRCAARLADTAEQTRRWQLVTVGSNWECKRLDLLFQSLQELRNHEVEFHLDVYGKPSSSERKRFTALASHLGLSNFITLHGVISRPDLQRVYQSSDIYVTASLQEAFGVSVVEALACGLEVVAFSSGGIKEILDPPSFCPVILAGDTRGFGAAILASMQRGEDCNRIEMRYRRARDFDKNVMLQQIANRYRDFS